MKPYHYFIFNFLTLIICSSLHSQYRIIDIDAHHKTVLLPITVNPDEQILTETLMLSFDNPNAQCTHQMIDPTPIKQYVSSLSTSKALIESDSTLQLSVSIDNPVSFTTNLFMSYMSLPQHTIIEKIIPITFNQSTPESPDSHLITVPLKKTMNFSDTTPKTFTEKLQNLAQNTNNNWLRLLFAFLLGMLLSLTPCIYPMIPITIGILHNQAQSSIMQNLLRSCSYAFGMSTTFATLGLIAAFAGASFGSLLSNPIFVICLIIFIGYMSLTMIGIINLTIPSFLQRNITMNNRLGQYFSAYFFGLISGSVASPCVSPGLALLLTLVATMGNIFAGFALLFCFGIGLSTPLIILTTFSSSLSMAPRAGMWMVEIKKALGFLMLLTCVYYISNIVSTSTTQLILIAYTMFVSMFYIIDAQKTYTTQSKTIKSILGIALMAIAILLALHLFDHKKNESHPDSINQITWATDYQTAVAQAQKENKKILLDFWAHHCTICKAIDKKIFHNQEVQKELGDTIIFYKVDCTHNNNQESNMLKNKFQVFAQPTILIIDPYSEAIIKRWSSEPYSMSPQEFVDVVLQV